MRRINLDFKFRDLVELSSHYKSYFKYAITKKPPNFPLVFHIQTINTCNGSCTMCPYSKKKPERVERISNELFEKIINEIVQHSKSSRYTYIHMYLQNEPILDKDIFRKLRYIKDKSKENVITGLTTNGTLLTPDKIPDLISSDLDELVVSLDAFTKETYSKIRKGLDFDKVNENLEALIKSDYKNSIFVEFTKQKENAKELNDFIEYWKKKGLPILLFNISNRGGEVENFDEYRMKAGKTVLLFRLKRFILKRMIRCCPLVLTTFNIRSNGDVIICCNDYTENLILGNINKNSIKEIWNSEKYKNIRKYLHDKELNKLPICKSCSIFKDNF